MGRGQTGLDVLAEVQGVDDGVARMVAWPRVVENESDTLLAVDGHCAARRPARPLDVLTKMP